MMIVEFSDDSHVMSHVTCHVIISACTELWRCQRPEVKGQDEIQRRDRREKERLTSEEERK